jgi:hypothetical protein
MIYHLTAAIAGIAGTALMTGFVYLIAYITGNNFKVVKILGTMLTNNTHRNKSTDESPETIITGIIAHYLIGVFFAIIYAWLWSKGIGEPTLRSSIIFGALNGLFAMLFWYTFFRLHRNPPAIRMPAYIVVIGIGHLFFSIGVVTGFSILY